MVVSRVHSPLRDLRHVLVAQILHPDHLARPALELAVFIDRYHYKALATVAGDRDGLCQGFVLVPAEMTLKLGCSHRNHTYIIPIIRKVLDIRILAGISIGAVVDRSSNPESGEVSVDCYTVVDDIRTRSTRYWRRAVQGGVAQGAGQALSEDVVYDRDSGQLLTGTLMDYGIPRADTLPRVTVDFSPVPSTTNPFGAKGVGEGGTVASTPTVMNAILDALAPLGVTDVPMPATPERIWRAIRSRGRG